MKSDSINGCVQCTDFLKTYFPENKKRKVGKSTCRELSDTLSDLFEAMSLSSIKVENTLNMNIPSFIKDIKRSIDEIKSPDDIVNLWHISMDLAENVFSVIQEVVFPGHDVILDSEKEYMEDRLSSDTESESESSQFESECSGTESESESSVLESESE